MKYKMNLSKSLIALLSALLLTVPLLTACDLSSTYGEATVTVTSGESEMSETLFFEDSVETGGTSSQITAVTESVSSSQGEKEPNKIITIPAYRGEPYVVINDNHPFFTSQDLTTVSFERYSPLDSLGRCGAAYACIGVDLMPTQERGSIGSVKPSGWQTAKYDFVDGKYLYNRCHLIGYQLTAENANNRNLITGTRYLNVEGMLPFENMTADYLKETGNHVLYRVTPIFSYDTTLVASGVLMEAYSVEDDGEGICFAVYCYNVQPGVIINYSDGSNQDAGTNGVFKETGQEQQPIYLDAATGMVLAVPGNDSSQVTTAVTASVTTAVTTSVTSAVTTAVTTDHAEMTTAKKADETTTVASTQQSTPGASYVLNTNTKKFHRLSCSYVSKIAEKNYAEYSGSRDDLISRGYSPCGKCHP